MPQKPPLPLTYASEKRKPIRLEHWVGFIVRATMVLVIGICLSDVDRMIAPRHVNASITAWILRLLPLAVAIALCGAMLIKALRGREKNRSDETWSASEVGRIEPADNATSTPRASTSSFGISGGTLGISAGTFSGMEVGCVGAVAMVVFCVAAVGGLLAMAWWTVLGK